MAALGDQGVGKMLHRTSLAISAVVGVGTAAAAAIIFWRRPRRQGAPALGQSAPNAQGVPWAEVMRHDRYDDAWLVIDGQVYDITQWLEHHPGGKLLLLAFAGRDATEPFETCHTAYARKELRVQTVHMGPLMAGSSALPRKPRTATLTGGRPGLGSCSSLDQLANPEPLWEVKDYGFLPSRDPVSIEALRDTPFEPFLALVDMLPALGFTNVLRQQIDGDRALQEQLLAAGRESALTGLSEDQLERAFSVICYTMVSYWRGGILPYSTGITGIAASESDKRMAGGSCGLSDVPDNLPPCLAKPAMLLSRVLGRPPMIDYASSVLYNWVRIDPNGPISMSNLRCAIRLTGLIDEEWFFKTHVVIESEASHAIAAVIALTETEDDNEFLSQLTALEEALWRVVRACLPIMYERAEDGTSKCSEHIFYHILRPLIKSGHLVFESDDASPHQKLFLSGPSGAMSSLLPCIDAALGINMTSEKLCQAMDKFKLSMPKAHQDFIDKLKGLPSIRQRILLKGPVAGDSASETYTSTVRAFNRVIARVLDFRWQHWQYVKNFIMKPGNLSFAVGSGGTSFDYLQQHITDTEMARLTERTAGNFDDINTPGLPPGPPVSTLPAHHIQHPALEYWSVDGARGLLAREPLMCPSKASWGKTLAPETMAAFVTLWNLAMKIPSQCAANGPYYECCAAVEDSVAALTERAIYGMSEAARENLMTTLCHISAGCAGCGHRNPPRCIAKPLQAVARSVGRPPRLEFSELVLSNWNVTSVAADAKQIDGDHANGTSDDQQEGQRLQVVWRFLGTPDEEWYRAIHMVLHEEARDVVAAIRIGHVAMLDQNTSGAVTAMAQLSAWLNKFCDFFDGFFETKDSRTESVMIRRLEPFISHGSRHDLTWEETACWVYCCSGSVLLPAIHAFLGVAMFPSSKKADETVGGSDLTLNHLVQRTVDEGRLYMPKAHRDFLEMLEKPGMSIRQFCFRRFGFKSESVEALHNLEVGYNDALNALVRFMSRRVHLTSRFFPSFGVMFGTLHGDYEAHVDLRRLQLLKMRQRVASCMESGSP